MIVWQGHEMTHAPDVLQFSALHRTTASGHLPQSH